MQEDLTQLRQRMADLDRQILELVAARLETSKAIGEAKRKAALPIRDFKVEVEVMARARRTAQQLGFDSEVGEKILEILVAAAVQTQVEQQTLVHPADARRILVVGGKGRMGQWLDRFLTAQGHKVSTCDPHGGTFSELAPALREKWDAIALSTPLGMLPATLRECLAAEGEPVVFDIGSLKSHLVEDLRAAAAAGHRVTSIHPMFAPGTVLLQGRTVLVCDAGCASATDLVRQMFAGTAVSLFETPLEEHDRLMAVLLGLSHATNLLFGAALPRFGLPFSHLGKVASTTFARQTATAAEVAAENPALYHEIQQLNRSSPEVYQHLADALDELRRAAINPDSGPFVRYMEGSRRFFYPE